MTRYQIAALFVCMCFGIWSVASNPVSESEEKIVCNSPYHAVGDVCMFIDNRIEGTWNQMRSLCMDISGDLAHFTDANHLHDVYNYLKLYNLNDSSFWVGADDLLDEGYWRWTAAYGAVRPNTPLWGPNPLAQEPTGGSAENCGMLNMEKYYYLYDEDCDALHGVICRPREIEEDDVKETPKDIRVECPLPFEPLGELCILLNEAGTNTWVNARDLCESLGGHLAKIDDANSLELLYDLFQNKSIEMDMWLGGADRFTEGNWHWLDNIPLKMGTPFWGMDTGGLQEPSGGVDENCLALRKQNYFFFHDRPCTEEAGAVCQYDLQILI